MTKDFGNLLKKLRLENKLSQPDLVVKIRGQGFDKYHKSDISKWENGRTRPPEDVVEILEDILMPNANGLLLKSAGYLSAAENRYSRAESSIAIALAKHFETLSEIILQWKEELVTSVSGPIGGYDLVFPSRFRRQDVELGIHHKGTLCWEVTIKEPDSHVGHQIGETKHVDVWLPVEHQVLFPCLKNHLQDKKLWQSFEDLKQRLAEGIMKADSTNQPRGVHVEGVFGIACSIAEQLEKAAVKGWFAGTCEACP